MGTYTGQDKRLQYLFQNGGGGTTVIANPAGSSTDTLNKLQVGSTIYDVPSGGGSSGHTYSTTEHIVGKWIDGRNIYECTYDLGSNVTISYNNNNHFMLTLSRFTKYMISSSITDSMI